MSRADLLIELSRDDDLLRRQAATTVESGLDELLSCKRLVQRLTLSEDEEADLYASLIKLNNAGIALRVMLQVQKQHHQRIEEPWADVEGSNGKLQSAALEYEADVQQFTALLREAVKVNRLEVKAEQHKHKEPEPEVEWAPSSPSVAEPTNDI